MLVCTGPCCDGDGRASAQLAALRELLVSSGLAEDDVGKASCVRRSCLGKCAGEPLAHVVPDDVWYRSLSADSLLRIYKDHALNGQPVAELIFIETD